jgi:hypothetical protein
MAEQNAISHQSAPPTGLAIWQRLQVIYGSLTGSRGCGKRWRMSQKSEIRFCAEDMQ